MRTIKNLLSKYLRTFGIWGIALLCGGALLDFGQTRPQEFSPNVAAAPAKASPAAPASHPAAPPTIPLTDSEAKDLQINQLQTENMDLQIERLQTQVMNARQKLADDTKTLTAKLAAAHNLDLAKYRLDPQAKAFVPIPPTPNTPPGRPGRFGAKELSK